MVGVRWQQNRRVARCSEEGCDHIASARGLCTRHYEQRRAAGTLPPIIKRPPRSEAVHIYVTEAEKEALFAAAIGHNASASAYAAAIVRGYLKKQRQLAAQGGGG